MNPSRWRRYTIVAVAAIVYIAIIPILFGFLSELRLLGADMQRRWSDVSWLLACFIVGVPIAITLARVLGEGAWKAGLLIGLLTIATFAFTQFLIELPMPLSESQKIRAWALNLIRAAIVPALTVLSIAFGKAKRADELSAAS